MVCTFTLLVHALSLGIPAVPSFGELTPGPDPGQVSISIKTVASGVSDPAAQGFAFVIVPVLGSTPGEGIRFPLPNYQSNMFETIIVRDLMPDQSYTFSATAVSDFGTSVPENSAPVQAGTHTCNSFFLAEYHILSSKVCEQAFQSLWTNFLY